ncbi:MAG: hypothetical protein ACRC5R_02340 [Mycoplasmatales bacterium]
MIRVRVKHIVIPCIVFAITFIIVTFNYYTLVANPTFDVGLLYNGPGITIQSEEKAVWDSLVDVQNKYSDNEISNQYDEINLNSYNKAKLTAGQLDEIVANKEVLYVLGDSFNDVLLKKINYNKRTKFVLIDNSMDFVQPNVIQISFDDFAIAKKSAISLFGISNTKKILYITTVPIDLQREKIDSFKESIPQAEVAIEYVKDINNNVSIVESLDRLYTNGYDGVYVANSELNDVVINQTKIWEVMLDSQILAENEKNNLLKPGEPKIAPKYQQNHIKVITNTFNTYDDGVYVDSNKDSLLGYPDLSIIQDSYLKDYDDTFLQLTKEIMEYDFNPRNIHLTPLELTESCQTQIIKC